MAARETHAAFHHVFNLAETLSSLWLNPEACRKTWRQLARIGYAYRPPVSEAPLMPVRLQAIELTSSAINAYTYQYNDKTGCLRTAGSLDRALTHGDVMTILIR